MGIEMQSFYEDVEEKKDKKEEKKIDDDPEKKKQKESEIQADMKGKINNWISYMPDDPNKPMIKNSDESLPGFNSDDFEIVKTGDLLSCKFKSEKGEVSINISNFEKPKEGEPEKNISVSITGDIQNIPELRQAFPSGYINTTKSEDVQKLINCINQKVENRKQDVHGIADSEMKKEKDNNEKIKHYKEILNDLKNWNESNSEYDSIENFLGRIMSSNIHIKKEGKETEIFTAEDGDLRIALVSIGVLLRHYTTDQINDLMNGTYEKNNQENTQINATEKTELSGAHIIEYLSNHIDYIGDSKLMDIANNNIQPQDFEDTANYIMALLFLQPN